MAITVSEIAHFTLEEYHRAIDAGLFCDRRVELIEGLIVEMPPEGTEHVYFEENLVDRLKRSLPGRAYIRESKPITLSNSEPEPDIVVARLPRSQYIEHHPFPEDISLLIEVSKATRNRDLSTKKQLYAAANIPEYWIVDIKNRKLIVFRSPESGDYQQSIALSVSETVSPLAFPDLAIAVSEIFAI
ncbi:MAG: Uma2 family endonuclease [Cyanobacteria bacterium P01_E01_bin.42]